MTVELKPETERLVHEEIEKGSVHTVDELIVRGVRALREERTTTGARVRKSVYELLTSAPFAGSGLTIERQKDYLKPASL